METTPAPAASGGLLDTQQVADELEVSVREVRKLIHLGLLRHWRVGRTMRVPRSALEEFKSGGTGGA